MKNNKLVSIVLVAIIFTVAMFIPKMVFAENVIDLRNQITNANSTSTSSSSSSSSSTSSSTTNNTIKNISTNNTTTNNTTNNAINNTLVTSNTSSNSNLPKTGVDSAVPGIILIVVLTISAVFAYRKIQYYKNI